MQKLNRLMKWSFGNLVIALAVALVAGCQTAEKPAASAASTPATPAASAAVAKPAATATPAAAAVMATPATAPVSGIIRIKSGVTTPMKDSEGNTWLPEQGFTEGGVVERLDLQIANTKIPEIYRIERYNMTSFTYPVPNGKYTVKLHFCETFEGITKPGERVFSYNVEGKAFKDFDIWVKSGGFLRAYVETVPIEVTDGKVDIIFTAQVEYPQINGIEIIPGN